MDIPVCVIDIPVYAFPVPVCIIQYSYSRGAHGNIKSDSRVWNLFSRVFGAFGAVSLPRTSHHKQLSCLTLHHEKLLIPATGIQFIPVLHTGIWHARENKFHTRESLFIFPGPCAPREYEY